MEITCADLYEFTEAARRLTADFKAPLLVTLSGNLGAGKTTFVMAILSYWKIAGAGSPTFNLRNDYKGPGFRVVHLVFYRVKPGDGGWDILPPDEDYSDAIVFVEWPEKADPRIFSPFARQMAILITVDKAGKRTLSFEAVSP